MNEAPPHNALKVPVGILLLTLGIAVIAIALLVTRYGVTLLPARTVPQTRQAIVGGQLDTSTMRPGEHELTLTGRTRSGARVQTRTTFVVEERGEPAARSE